MPPAVLVIEPLSVTLLVPFGVNAASTMLPLAVTVLLTVMGLWVSIDKFPLASVMPCTSRAPVLTRLMSPAPVVIALKADIVLLLFFSVTCPPDTMFNSPAEMAVEFARKGISCAIDPAEFSEKVPIPPPTVMPLTPLKDLLSLAPTIVVGTVFLKANVLLIF